MCWEDTYLPCVVTVKGSVTVISHSNNGHHRELLLIATEEFLNCGGVFFFVKFEGVARNAARKKNAHTNIIIAVV